MFISFFLAAFIIVAVHPVAAELNCGFDRGACDWRQLKSNCSWGVSSKRGLAFVQNYCANATLKANVGWYEKKDLHLKYYMNGEGKASLTVNAGIGNDRWDAKPFEVYSCEHPMGITWNTDHIRLPENTKYVTIEAVIDKDAKFIIALDQIETGNSESDQEFVKECTPPSTTTKSLLITTEIQMNTSNQTEVATTTQITNPAHKNVTSLTTKTTLSPTTIYSKQKSYESGRDTTSTSFTANSFTSDSSTTTLPLTTTESLTTPGSVRTNKVTTSLPQTEIYRKPTGIKKDNYYTSTEIDTTNEPTAEATITTEYLSTSSLPNQTVDTITTEMATTSEPITTTEVKTSEDPTTTTEVTTASTTTVTTDNTSTRSQTTTQPSTTTSIVPQIITSVLNGKFFQPKVVSITRTESTPTSTRKAIFIIAAITSEIPTTLQPTKTATRTKTASKTTIMVKPTEYRREETTTHTSPLTITPNIIRPSTINTTTVLSDATDECLYCFNQTDSVLNATTVRPYDSDATIGHLSTIIVVASFFGILLIYCLLKFFISSLLRWRKNVKVDKNEKDMPERSQPITPGLYIVDDTGLNGRNEAVSGSTYRTRQDSIYHMELPSQN